MAERNKIYFEIILLLYFAFLTTTFISCKNKITAQAEDNAKFIASNGLISTGKFVSPKNPSKLTIEKPNKFEYSFDIKNEGIILS